jgi:quinohemoprotein ethanol dehydrogenase
LAWNPVTQKEAWRVEHVSPWNGGTLVTAGNLVFQGTAEGRFIAFNATTGAKLWESATGNGVIAAPSTYVVDGRQYVSIAVGWGGSFGLHEHASDKTRPGTVYTFALGGKAALPPFVQYHMEALVSGVKYDPALVAAGQALYVSHCVLCHGIPAVERGGNIPNLAYVGPDIVNNLEKFVLEGQMKAQGMPDFAGKLTKDDLPKLRAFIMGTADLVRAAARAAAPKN